MPAGRRPRIANALTANRQLPFVDVFCETGAFDLAQSRQILLKAKELGFPLKLHADEFDNLGGASLAVELGAVSADHLVKTSAADIAALARSETVAVSLPCTPFGLAESGYTPARQILEAGGLLALATDCNPGTAWCESMQFVIALACRALKLTPAQAIAAATINAAHAIRRADTIGSIEPGKQADLLILACPDYRQLGYRFGTNLARYVIKRGKIYSVDSGVTVHASPSERPYRRSDLMTINFSEMAPFIWVLAAVLVLVGVGVVIRFFWHHVLRFVIHAGIVIVAVVLIFAILRYLKVF